MITSRQNPWFKRVRAAVREHAEEIVIEGRKAVADAIAAGWMPIALVRRGDALDDSPSSALPSRSDDVIFAPELFDQLGDTRTSQDTLALFARPPAGDVFARRDALVVALDGVQDPGNVGTMIRLAAAFDAAGVALLPACADPFAPKAIRASAGAVLNVPLAPMSARELLDCGLPLFAAAGDGAAVDPPARGAVLVFGNEGAGVSAELRAAASPIAIATSGRVESLNVAASAAILLSRAFSLRS
jgi:TrmH family RNA methyltransferase